MPQIRFEDVSVRYDGTAHHVLDRITLELSEHRIGIIGANGSGKSTLARLVNGLGEPTSGRVLVDGADVARHGRDIRRRVGFVFSDAENQIVMPQVRDDVAFSLRRLRLPKAERTARVDAALERFGLTELAEASPHTLSGGQKQLLALASVLVIEPDLIIADEPTTLLDLRNRLRIAHEFAGLPQQLIVVTHDLELLADFDRVLCLDGGRVIADGAPDEVCGHYRRLMAEQPL
ncbi:energy-coupling factor ABC transporter ATP-binding protein [Corynebacterium halotolerans]|uniref:ABC transport system, ATP-binding protein n=1 Tax=Corynebacterium halotolerans YIM 70093 = DSM 44683 TaxID=1121362 RepID=M1NYW5_9CORY|nr:ABC transporter ATP-binding protein [Corynebacterium halotolerans]AGF72700.1 ABC transport system, ATP-binding protein [Corynebacterium halotolerans YIM 70093 = DSM 44683]